MLAVHVRVNDAATGQPTPVRIRFVDDAGTAHVPFGRLAEFAVGPGEDVGGNLLVGSERWSYIDGTCEVRLPARPVTVLIQKGPEYSPVRHTATLGPGKIALRLAVERWVDLRPDGWFSGDTRCHYLDLPAALLEAAAEDLAVVNLLAFERPTSDGRAPATPSLLGFSGMRSAIERPGHLVAVNTLNAHPIQGTVALLNCHRVVYPLRSGVPGPDDWSVADWCDQCHRKKGLVVWPDLPRQSQGEALAALLLGKIDAFEISHFADPEPAVLADYYRLLDSGVRIPLVGGSGKDSNAVALGAVRTYARLMPGEPLSYRAWIEAVRAGRTFVTNGPLLSFTVDGVDAGVVVPATGRPVRLRAEARSIVPFDQLELLVNGSVVASKTASGNRQAAVLEAEVMPSGSGWLAARCWGREFLPSGARGQCVYAHSSPVYLT